MKCIGRMKSSVYNVLHITSTFHICQPET